MGLQLHLPEATFAGELFPLAPGQPAKWKIRGANLCAWETGLQPPLAEEEIAIDPVIGRLVIGVGTAPRATALKEDLRVTYTYGAVGPVGAHPISYGPLPDALSIPAANVRSVDARKDAAGLLKALKNIHLPGEPIVIEIHDSLTHKLDLTDPFLTNEKMIEGGSLSLVLNRPLVIRAADGQRPIIELAQPLRFRPLNVVSPAGDSQEQHKFNAVMSTLVGAARRLVRDARRSVSATSRRTRRSLDCPGRAQQPGHHQLHARPGQLHEHPRRPCSRVSCR